MAGGRATAGANRTVLEALGAIGEGTKGVAAAERGVAWGGAVLAAALRASSALHFNSSIHSSLAHSSLRSTLPWAALAWTAAAWAAVAWAAAA